MALMSWAARVLTGVVHEVVTEYRQLDSPPQPAVNAEPVTTEINCTSASVRDRWQPVQVTPAAARAIGFRPSDGGGAP